jgi:hypothetical protein
VVLKDVYAAESLLSSKVSVNCREEDGDTPLHVACAVGCEPLARLLVAAKAHLDAVDIGGNRPEDDASDAGHHSLSQLLREELRGESSPGAQKPDSELDMMFADVAGRHARLKSRVDDQVGRGGGNDGGWGGGGG